MKRGLTGRFVASVAGHVNCQAFVPAPLPPDPPLKISNKLQRSFEEASLALGRLDAITVLLHDTSLFIYSYVRKEAVMSSQIEGTQSSLNDLMIYEMKGLPGVPMDDVKEVSCYVNALNLGIERIREGYPITFRLVTELHQTLMTHGRGTHLRPGEFRKNQVWIGDHRADKAIFVPPPANELTNCWSDFERFLNDQSLLTPVLTKAALSHVQFETIHPFMDGNGRLGRLLIPLILVESGILKEPLLYLSVFFKQYRQSYYEHLQQVRLTGNWEEWLRFFVDAISTTANEAVETAQALSQLLVTDKSRLSDLGRRVSSATQVLDALFVQPITNISELQHKTGLTFATIGKALDALGRLGIVQELTGQKRDRLFAYEAYLELLMQE